MAEMQVHRPQLHCKAVARRYPVSPLFQVICVIFDHLHLIVLTATTDPPSSRLPMSLEMSLLSRSWFTEPTTLTPSCLDCESFVPPRTRTR